MRDCSNNKRISAENQRGTVLVLVAVSLTVIMLMMALSLDFGWMILARSELQTAADAAALASAAQLVDEDCLFGIPSIDDDLIEARNFAEQFAGLNTAAKVHLLLDRNEANQIEGGVVIGHIQNPFDIHSPLVTENVDSYNSVKVVTELSPSLNGPLGLFWGSVTGSNELAMNVASTATLDDRVVGFSVHANQRLNVLPFSLQVDVWDSVFALTCHSSPIRVPEPFWPVIGMIDIHRFFSWLSGPAIIAVPTIKIYPNDPETPGNFGTIDIGPDANSTDHLAEQIQYGPLAEDIDYIGGLYLSDEDGDGLFTKWFNGDTGVSASLKSAIQTIYEEPRILPLHRQVTGSGDTARYEVCRYVGVKIVDMKMMGALEYRYIEVEPMQIVTPEAVIDPNAPSTHFLYALSLTR